MKTQIIRFHVDLEVSYPDHLEDDWVREKYLSSDRFSVEGFPGEPGIVTCAHSHMEKSETPSSC
jgi:hypothetical protein